jgi:2-oxoglutarate dehydrogenase E1 component
VFYDLVARRDDKDRRDTAILRLEQLYPFPDEQLREALSRYTAAERFVWVQEEPRNRGAWSFVSGRAEQLLPHGALEYVGRSASASPATGSYKKHMVELEQFLSALFG